MGKTVKVRKPHECNACGELIEQGEKCAYMSGRAPKFDGGDNQIGIEYYNIWFHLHNCTKPPSCKEGQHKWVTNYVADGPVLGPEDYVSDGKICDICYDVKMADK